MGVGNHQTEGGPLIWCLACLFILPLEFVKIPSMGQSSAYRLSTVMAGIRVRGGSRPAEEPTVQASTSTQGLCLHSDSNGALANPAS